MILDIPYLHCLVDKQFLTNEEQGGYVEAYAFAVTAMKNRPLLFTVHTIHGAIFSRLPVWALMKHYVAREVTETPFPKPIPNALLQPWSCLSDRVQVVSHSYLKDYWVQVTLGKETAEGRYLMTFDFFPSQEGSFAEDPEQHKTFNLIELETGQYCLAPNNHCRFLDKHFATEPGGYYKRNTTYFMTED